MKQFLAVSAVLAVLFAVPAYTGWKEFSNSRSGGVNEEAAQMHYCPICNMRLVPMPQEKEEAAQPVSMAEHAKLLFSLRLFCTR